MKEQITNLANDVLIEERGQAYLEKALLAMTNFIELLQSEFENIKSDEESYRFLATKLIAELNTLYVSFEGISATPELSLVAQLSFPRLYQIMMDHNLNHLIDLKDLAASLTNLKNFT